MGSTICKAILILVLLLPSACKSDPPPLDLGRCWNVSQVAVGPVKGRGVFSTSMHGMALLAPDCDDRAGGNRYDLSFQADQAIRSFSRTSNPRYIGFAFKGRIVIADGQKKLLISSIDYLSIADEPTWVTKVKRTKTKPVL